VADVWRAFQHPSGESRPLMRWWWFGPSVSHSEIERELIAMRDAGIGGVEVQPVYPVALDDPAAGIHNDPYLSPAFLANLKFAADAARRLRLRIDITLGSGWPFGGATVPVTQSAGRLRYERVPIPPGTDSIACPALENGEAFLRAFLVDGDGTHSLMGPLAPIRELDHGCIRFKPASHARTALIFISSRTGQQVKRAAVGAEGFVLNHMDRAAVEKYLQNVGEPLVRAFGDKPPDSVFSDSLEVYGSDWTPDFLEEFQRRRGYDLSPWLPALISDMGPRTSEIRHDWGKTLTELVEERYLVPVREWAHQHGTKFRSQTYGSPPVILSSSSLVDLSEGEGFQWRSFSTSRWASSTNHLYSRAVTSSECWTWLHSPAFRATPLDMKVEADLHFLQGINQIVGHGWPYSPPQAGEPGWRFYAAAALNDHNPWWIVMPDVMAYLERISFVLRQGRPANDIAIYLPTDDIWSGFTAGKDSVNQALVPLFEENKLIPAILDAGFNFDFIDDRAIAERGVPYKALVLPEVQHMPDATRNRIGEFKKTGLVVVDSTNIKNLRKQVQPDFFTGNPAIGFIHRHLADGELYFIANTSNRPVRTTAMVGANGLESSWWDPFTLRRSTAGGTSVDLELEPFESRILVYSKRRSSDARESSAAVLVSDLSADWHVSFPAPKTRLEFSRLHSWTDDKDLRFFSGTAIYSKELEIAVLPAADKHFWLSLGTGVPGTTEKQRRNGMRAELEPPVREAAVVYVNDQKAGAVWRPPYRVEITPFIHTGRNTLRIEVANTAINEMAGQPRSSYRLLNLRYGARFEDQDMDHLEPVPSGLLGPVQILQR
jgi:hypothetical protein